MSAFDNFGPVLLGFFVFFFTFLVSGVTFVQERRSGTLERMLATPIRRHELVIGYALGFSVVVSNPDPSSNRHLGEVGWGGAASTHFWISQKDELVVVVLSQREPFTQQLEVAIKPLVYEAIQE